MDWNLCEKKFIKYVEVDKEKIKSIIEMGKKRQKYIENTEVNNENCSFIIEGYYEVIKELLAGLLLSKGIISKNHQCLITYFYKNYSEYEFEANFISQLSYLRNRLNYYGESIEIGFYQKNINMMERIIYIIEKLIII